MLSDYKNDIDSFVKALNKKLTCTTKEVEKLVMLEGGSWYRQSIESEAPKS